jgi:hypothetical protein
VVGQKQSNEVTSEDPLFAGFDDPDREARHRGSIVSLNLAVV